MVSQRKGMEGCEMIIETLDILKDEGKTETMTRKKMRYTCDNCGEPAHFKHTFLLPNARTNPASKGYGKDEFQVDFYNLKNVEDRHFIGAMILSVGGKQYLFSIWRPSWLAIVR